MPDPLIPPLRDPDYLVQLLARITGRPVDQVIERLRLEETDIGRTVRAELQRRRITPFVWSEALDQFYAETDAFLYESLVWNVTRHKNSLRQWIGAFLSRVDNHRLRILLFGDGLGLDSYYLAQAGHDVISYEVARLGVAFADAIRTTGGMRNWTIVSDCQTLPAASFDAVVCLDVLEHVPDPPALVRRISRLLRPGGYLIVHAPFFYVHPAVATHLEANRRYSGDLRQLYRPAGLRLVDGRLFWDPIVLQKIGRSANASLRRRVRTWLLRGSGWLLAVGRYTSFPHVRIAHHLTRARRTHLTGRLSSNGP